MGIQSVNKDLSFSELIKSETRSLHKQLEKKLNFPHSFKSLEAYHEILWFYYYFQLEVRRQSASFKHLIPASLNPEERDKLMLIESDIQHSAQTVSTDALSYSLSLNSLDEFMGFFYVEEGSTLGGKHIVACLEKYHGPAIRSCASYLDPYGDQCNAMWDNFKYVLEDMITNGQIKPHRVIVGAIKTYHYLHELVDRCGINDRQQRQNLCLGI